MVQRPGLRAEAPANELVDALLAAPRDLPAFAVGHGVAGVAYRNVRHLQRQFPELVAELDEARRAAWSSHVIKLADLAEVASVLAGVAGQWAVVKGPVLAECSYGRGDLRSYEDIDILVHPARFGEALRLLEDSGGQLLDRNWRLIRSSRRAELSVLVHDRTVVDLHWHLLNERLLRSGATWDMSALLGRAVPRDVGGIVVPILEPVDALVHVATHACLSGAHRLVWLKDVEQQQLASPVGADQLQRRAEDAGVWPPVHLALQRAGRTLGVPVPGHAPLWSRFNTLAGAADFSPKRATGNGRALALATRRTATASFGALAAAVWSRQVSQRARRLGAQRWIGAGPPTLEELRRPGGGPDEREAYLADAANEPLR